MEFDFEREHWFNLLKLPPQKAVAIMENQLKNQRQLMDKEFNLTENDLLYPIPQTEIDNSGGVVEQN